MLPLTLYCKYIPVGAVMTIVPVGVVQFGWTVTEAVGVAGFGVIARIVEGHIELTTITEYIPACEVVCVAPIAFIGSPLRVQIGGILNSK